MSDDSQHVHIHLPPEFAPRRTSTHDAPPRRPVVRGRDQAEPEEVGALLCKIMQNGETGEWEASDYDGNSLMVRSAGDRTLEILHHPDNGNGNGNGEPVALGMQTPISRDANAGAPGELVPGQAYARGLAKTLAPSNEVADRNPASIGRLQKLMAAHYRRR